MTVIEFCDGQENNKWVLTASQAAELKRIRTGWDETGGLVRRIVAARITPMPENFGDPMPQVMVRFGGDADERKLFEFYPDEIQFTADEFIGLTESEAYELKRSKDLAYLTS
jgi:hypothetical protein